MLRESGRKRRYWFSLPGSSTFEMLLLKGAALLVPIPT